MAEFQKEYIYVKKLPYFDELQKEADYQLSVIKAGLGRAVLLREIRPALLHWACELDKYIYLYGWRFTKDDHILFIKVLYELVIMQDLEYRMVKTFARLLTTLLEKKELISRDELVIDWRPLYKIYVFLAYKDLEEDGLLLLPQDMLSNFEQLIRVSRVYFPASATQEMLDEFRPYICPWDMSFVRAINCFNLFLPTYVSDSEVDISYKLWFDELMFWWLNIQNSPPWEQKIIGLLARIARDNIGRIDWNPYLPEVFTKILRYFGLSIVCGPSKEKVDVGHNSWQAGDFELIAILLACMLGGTSEAQQYINRLFDALSSYYHPSNSGSWSDKLMTFLYRLPLNVCLRVHKERHKKPDKMHPIPDDWKLTDKCLDNFVNALLPSALSALFAKMRSDSAANALRCLASLAPNLVVPAVLERVNSAFDTLSEPHRLLQSLSSLAGIVLPVLRPKWKCTVDTDPRLHILPLMNAALPGIDPNDASKSMVTFQILSLFGVLIPFVDSSEAVHLRSDLTDIETELASATATFEDFVVQFMDKVLNMVENSALSHSHGSSQNRAVGSAVRFSPEETVLKSGMFSSVRSIIANCSTAIYEFAFQKFLDFITNTVLEGRVAADMVSELCYAFSRTNPSIALPRFLDMLKKKLKSLITEDIYSDQELSDSVMWYLLIFGQVVRTDGRVLADHKESVLELLRLVKPLKAKEAYEGLCLLLEHLLTALCTTYTNNFDTDRAQADKAPDEYFPIRHWAQPYDMDNTEIVWHDPSDSELQFAKDILKEFLFDELESLDSPQNLSKEDVLKSLSIVKGSIAGAAVVLPWLDGEDYSLVESLVSTCPFSYRVSVCGKVLDWNGENIRRLVYVRIQKLMHYLFEHTEDDTKSLAAISRIFSLLLFHRGIYKNKFDIQSKGLQAAKLILTDKVVGKRSNPKPMVVELAFTQQNKRLLERPSYYFTKTHLLVMRDLLKLATSVYSEVRKEGQRVLDACFSTFPYSYKLLLSDILKLLEKDPAVSHEHLKGALYVLMSNKKRSLLIRNDWETLCQIWPAVVRAQHSEKPSIIQLLDSLHNAVVDHLESFQIRTVMSPSCLAAAEQFWSSNSITNGAKPAWDMPTKQELAVAEKREADRNDNNQKAYTTLIHTLVSLVNDPALHWRHVDMAQSFLSLMLRLDAKVPREAVAIFVRLLINDSMKTRKLAVAFLGAILKILKRKAKTLEISYEEIQKKVQNGRPVQFKAHVDGMEVDCDNSIGANAPVLWGFRYDNQWLLYEPDSTPSTNDEWRSNWFVDKTHWGFYSWPKSLNIHQTTEIDEFSCSGDKISPEEKPIFDNFLNPVFVEKFLELLTVEEKKGEDQFHTTNFVLFRGLFRNFGDSFLEVFKPHIERLMQSAKDNEQRVAAEFVAGVVQGTKRWPLDRLEKLWEWMGPLLTTALDNVTNETFGDWGSCVATSFDSRDPAKLRWFIEILFGLASKPIEAAFSTACRFFFLQGGINQLEWRVMSLWERLFVLIRPMLVQPYQNLRDRLGSCLATIFWFDLPGITAEACEPKRRVDFLAEICEELAVLWQESESSSPDETRGLTSIKSAPDLQQLNGTNVKMSIDAGHITLEPKSPLLKVKNSVLVTAASNPNFVKMAAAGPMVPDERKASILLLKTVLCYFASHWSHGYCSAPPEILKFLPLLAYFENETSDDELKRDCHFQLLHGLGRSLLHRNNVPVLLDIIKQASSMNWWKARVSVLHFLRISVFSNFFLLKPEQTCEVSSILLNLLKDPQIEVRQSASETLSGFLHCSFFSVDGLIQKFCEWAKNPAINIRHGGVLGLSAVVQASPYSVPPHLPKALVALSAHANAKQPIQATVKKALSEFKRTHSDNWHEHKKFFEEDELLMLTDLLVSPNYYV